MLVPINFSYWIFAALIAVNGIADHCRATTVPAMPMRRGTARTCMAPRG